LPHWLPELARFLDHRFTIVGERLRAGIGQIGKSVLALREDNTSIDVINYSLFAAVNLININTVIKPATTCIIIKVME
jgi:hypothetical protein